MCTHCLLSPLISLSLSFHIRAHKIYWCLCSRTGSDPSLFLLFWSPFYTPASRCPEPKDCWVEPPCEEGRWYSLPVLFIVSALTLSGNLSSPTNQQHNLVQNLLWSQDASQMGSPGQYPGLLKGILASSPIRDRHVPYFTAEVWWQPACKPNVLHHLFVSV